MSLEVQLRAAIAAQLDYCDVDTTPKLCEMLRIEGNYEKVMEDVTRYVRKDGLLIAEAIIQVERDYNPNIIDD